VSFAVIVVCYFVKYADKQKKKKVIRVFEKPIRPLSGKNAEKIKGHKTFWEDKVLLCSMSSKSSIFRSIGPYRGLY